MSDIITFNTSSDTVYSFPTSEFKCSGYGLGKLSREMFQPIVLEIGCDIGDTAEFLMRAHPKLELVSIDPYENYVDWNGNNLNEREIIYERMMKRMDPFSDRFHLIRKTSDEAAKMFADEHFDIIFIDGLHTYEQLTKDCANFYSKLKTDGIFAGHDYNAIAGVRQAADEFAFKVGREIHFTECDVWYWIK
jgi:predicted O-methyltransferase YrrM